MTPGFIKQPLTRYVAVGMRAATKGKVFDGHKFAFNDLKELWISDDEIHVIATHATDTSWQYWHNSPDGGWKLHGTHLTRKGAQDAALANETVESQPETGTYVVASAGQTHRPIRVHCTSTEGPKILVGIFERLGYKTAIEEVGEAVQV